jgi:iron(III) transport system substrate-binding protein
MKSRPGAAASQISRRQFLQTSAAVVAAGSGVLSSGRIAEAQGNVAALYEAAKKEGKLVWWCGHFDQTGAETIRKAFMATYPGIEVDFIRQTAQVVYGRIQQNLKAGIAEVDAFGTANAGHWPLLKKQNALAAFTPSGASVLAKPFKSIDPDSTFHVAGVELVIINYRTDKVNPPPSKWTDLLDPQWANKLTFGSPAFSGNVVNWTIAMLDKYGEDFIKQLAKNNPKIGRSILETGTDILAGERLVGHGQDANTFVHKAAGNPIDVKFPDDDAVVALGYTGILKDAPHPNAARLFMEFHHSKEYSEALVRAYRFPIRNDVPSFSGQTLEQVKTFQSSIERLSSGTAEAIAKWRAVMGV